MPSSWERSSDLTSICKHPVLTIAGLSSRSRVDNGPRNSDSCHCIVTVAVAKPQKKCSVRQRRHSEILI
ncbi:hypothetical protein TNCV_3087521 [Trichonephila clavipes]|uniref:Uncharacterized protein n=1 Tax=Trichonephila clavipes TaxID=2585209 RepID=A0A8X6RGE8_TRICX|nr:hypothetical protein TNCV_3087521 [Trichonephila clavipes]